MAQPEQTVYMAQPEQDGSSYRERLRSDGRDAFQRAHDGGLVSKKIQEALEAFGGVNTTRLASSTLSADAPEFVPFANYEQSSGGVEASTTGELELQSDFACAHATGELDS